MTSFYHVSASKTTLFWETSSLIDLRSVLGRPPPCLGSAIRTPCTLPLPVFVTIVLRSLLRLMKCEIIHFGDPWQKALSSWKFRIFCSAPLRILKEEKTPITTELIQINLLLPCWYPFRGSVLTLPSSYSAFQRMEQETKGTTAARLADMDCRTELFPKETARLDALHQQPLNCENPSDLTGDNTNP